MSEEDVYRLEDGSEILLRQVHPNHLFDDGSMSSVAFQPGPNDALRLSTRREALGAEQAFKEWTKTSESSGTWGVSVGEVHGTGLFALDDSAMPEMPEAHASVAFDGLSRGRVKQSARKLRDAAQNRNCLYP